MVCDGRKIQTSSELFSCAMHTTYRTISKPHKQPNLVSPCKSSGLIAAALCTLLTRAAADGAGRDDGGGRRESLHRLIVVVVVKPCRTSSAVAQETGSNRCVHGVLVHGFGRSPEM